MGFVKKMQDIVAYRKETADFLDAEMIIVYWETRADIIARLLPKPLKPGKKPLVIAFVANYPSSNYFEPYRESALFIRAEFNGEEGNYCLSMPVTDDAAMAAGREKYGFPKKIGNINISRNGDNVTAWTERHGIRFMEIKVKLTGRTNEPEALDAINGFYNLRDGVRSFISYNIKSFPAPEGNGFDYKPRLVRQETLFRPKTVEPGEAEIIFIHSDYDSWHELEVVKMLGAEYTMGDNSMLKGSVIAEADPAEFLPYSFLKWDVAEK